MATADLTPEPIKNLGIIVNVTDRTVTFMDYVMPVTGISEPEARVVAAYLLRRR